MDRFNVSLKSMSTALYPGVLAFATLREIAVCLAEEISRAAPSTFIVGLSKNSTDRSLLSKRKYEIQ